MAQMIRGLRALLLAAPVLFLPAGAQAAAEVPPEALKAEMEQRWDDALRIYSRILRDDPSRADLWLRVADIYAALKQPESAADALAEAARLRPRDAPLQARLSQTLAIANRPAPALAAIRRALELDPENREYLRAQAELAAWNGELELAEQSYLRLAAEDSTQLKSLARLQARGGRLDMAVKTYARYRLSHPEDTAVLLDQAEIEGYRGNFSTASYLLESYRAREGETEDWQRAWVAFLARSGYPVSALEGLAALREKYPDDYELSLTRALALNARRQPLHALAELSNAVWLQPGRPETRGAFLQVRTPLRSWVGGGADFYTDHTGIALTHLYAASELGDTHEVRTKITADHRTVRADPGTGFETASGELSASVNDVMVAARMQFVPDLAVTLGGGVARYEDSTVRSLYSAALEAWTGERLNWTISSRREPLAVSPRALDLNLSRDAHRVAMLWQPGHSAVIDLRGGWFEYSDGNRSSEIELAPRYAALRTQRHNFDIGLYGQWLSYEEDLSNGYYDPADFRRYWVTAHYYWKGGENYGFGAVLGLGPERDRALDTDYRFGGNLYLGGVIGIYSDWQLRAYAGYGGRLDSAQYTTGTPEGYSVGVELIRRF